MSLEIIQRPWDKQDFQVREACPKTLIAIDLSAAQVFNLVEIVTPI